MGSKDEPLAEGVQPTVGFISGSCLKQTRTRFSQGTTLAFGQWHMRGEGLTSHALTRVNEAIAAAVHIRIVDLSGVANEHELGAP